MLIFIWLPLLFTIWQIIMKFLIDLLIGIILLALCYIIFVVIVKLPELAEIKSKVGVQAKKIYKILKISKALNIFLKNNFVEILSLYLQNKN